MSFGAQVFVFKDDDPDQKYGALLHVNDDDLKWVDYEPLKKVGIEYTGLTIDLQNMQQLMDDLWAAGVRPTEGSGSAGSMAAAQAHLQDMRVLVEKAYKIEFNK
jgi:hypothetical protein